MKYWKRCFKTLSKIGENKEILTPAYLYASLSMYQYERFMDCLYKLTKRLSRDTVSFAQKVNTINLRKVYLEMLIVQLTTSLVWFDTSSSSPLKRHLYFPSQETRSRFLSHNLLLHIFFKPSFSINYPFLSFLHEHKVFFFSKNQQGTNKLLLGPFKLFTQYNI